MEENTDIINTMQFALFVRGIDMDFYITKKLAALALMGE
jgi:hypothetical protein